MRCHKPKLGIRRSVQRDGVGRAAAPEGQRFALARIRRSAPLTAVSKFRVDQHVADANARAIGRRVAVDADDDRFPCAAA